MTTTANMSTTIPINCELLIDIFKFLIPNYELQGNFGVKSNYLILNDLIRNYQLKKVLDHINKDKKILEYSRLYLMIYDISDLSYNPNINCRRLSDFPLVNLIDSSIVKYYNDNIALTSFNVNIIYNLDNNIYIMHYPDQFINNKMILYIKELEEIKTLSFNNYIDEIKKMEELSNKFKGLIFLKFLKDPNLKYINELLILINQYDIFDMINNNYNLFNINHLNRFIIHKINVIKKKSFDELRDSVFDREGVCNISHRFLRLINDYKDLKIKIRKRKKSGHKHIFDICNIILNKLTIN